jgi:hypothetical protein
VRGAGIKVVPNLPVSYNLQISGSSVRVGGGTLRYTPFTKYTVRSRDNSYVHDFSYTYIHTLY